MYGSITNQSLYLPTLHTVTFLAQSRVTGTHIARRLPGARQNVHLLSLSSAFPRLPGPTYGQILPTSRFLLNPLQGRVRTHRLVFCESECPSTPAHSLTASGCARTRTLSPSKREGHLRQAAPRICSSLKTPFLSGSRCQREGRRFA